MNWDRIEGNWKQVKGSVHQRWGNLTGNQLEVTLGKRTKISGEIQEIFGIAKDSNKSVSAWHAGQKNISI